MNKNLEKELLSLQDAVSEAISASGALKGAMNRDENFPPKLAEFPDANIKLLRKFDLIISELKKSRCKQNTNQDNKTEASNVMTQIRQGEILKKDLKSISSVHDRELYFHSWVFREAEEIILCYPLMHDISIRMDS